MSVLYYYTKRHVHLKVIIYPSLQEADAFMHVCKKSLPIKLKKPYVKVGARISRKIKEHVTMYFSDECLPQSLPFPAGMV